MHLLGRVALSLCLLLTGVSAQNRTVEREFSTLRDQVFQARTAIALLRTGDFQLRETLTQELDAVQRETDALQGRIAAGGPVEPATLTALAERVDTVRRRARSAESVTGQGLGPTAVATGGTRDLQPLDVPSGTLARVRLLQAVDLSRTGGGAIEAATVDAVVADDRTIAPAGALLTGTVTAPRGTPMLVFTRIQIGYTTWVVTAEPMEGPATRLRAGDLLRVRLNPLDAPR